jgi:hypothetical protein
VEGAGAHRCSERGRKRRNAGTIKDGGGGMGLVVALSARIFDALHVCMIEGIHMDTAGPCLEIPLCFVLLPNSTSDQDSSLYFGKRNHDFCADFQG